MDPARLRLHRSPLRTQALTWWRATAKSMYLQCYIFRLAPLVESSNSQRVLGISSQLLYNHRNYSHHTIIIQIDTMIVTLDLSFWTLFIFLNKFHIICHITYLLYTVYVIIICTWYFFTYKFWYTFLYTYGEYFFSCSFIDSHYSVCVYYCTISVSQK